VDYDVRSQRVTAHVDDQDLGMTVTNAMGMALKPWDLHVGAVLNIMDRRVTLRNANLAVRSRLRALVLCMYSLQDGTSGVRGVHAQHLVNH
jgi:hypothetical protein